jgi:hypothetical protein
MAVRVGARGGNKVTKPRLSGPSLQDVSPLISIRRHTRYWLDADCATFPR